MHETPSRRRLRPQRKKGNMAPLSTPEPREATIQLRDGRKLSYLEVGPADGTPLIHCHGDPSSRLEVLFLAEEAIVQGVRVIGFDRPGLGRSDPKPGFGLLDWPDDVMEAADRLGIGRFAVSGFSGGGPPLQWPAPIRFPIV
jgi:alpha-beta hydrolase superfamily lysophospholipase